MSVTIVQSLGEVINLCRGFASIQARYESLNLTARHFFGKNYAFQLGHIKSESASESENFLDAQWNGLGELSWVYLVD